MKTNKLLFILIMLTIAILNSSCMDFINVNGISGSKNYITRDYKIDGFNKIKSSTICKVSYTQSTDGTSSLQVYGSDNIVELVNVEIKDSTLVINMLKKNIKDSKLEIRISSPEIFSIKSEGVGNFTIKDKVETPELTVKNEGVGNVKIQNIICDNLKMYTNGVGNATLKGTAKNVTLASQGIGNIDADELIGENVEAKSEGIGNVSCYATSSLTAKVEGIGNITYKGNPAQKNLKKEGIGSIKKK